MLLQSNFYPTLLYVSFCFLSCIYFYFLNFVVFVFFLAFLSTFLISPAFIFNYKNKKTKKKQRVTPTAIRLFIFSLHFYRGGTLCALRTMLTSVVGVGIHWLEPTMRMLHILFIFGTLSPQFCSSPYTSHCH